MSPTRTLFRARRRAGSFGLPAGLFLLLLVFLPLVMPTADTQWRPIQNALVFGFALAAAVALPIPDPAKAYSCLGLGLCTAGAVCSLPNLAKFPWLAPALHVLGQLSIGGAFVAWSAKGFREPAAAAMPASAAAPQIAAPAPAPTPAPAPVQEIEKTQRYTPAPADNELQQRIKELSADLEFLEALENGLMQCVPAQVLILSGTLRVRLCNSQFREFFRLAPKEEEDKELSQLIPNKELIKVAQEALTSKDVKELEFRHYVKKAGERRLLARLYGGVAGNLILCLQELIEVTGGDQPSRLPKTQIINVQAEKLQLAGGLFDDMENAVSPGLAQIRGTVESLVHRTDVPATVREALENARAQVLGLERMVKSFAKFAEQHLDVAEQIGIVPTLEGALDPKNFPFELTGITIQKDFGLKRPKVEANEKQLRQAFINVFTNAFEAIRRRGTAGEVAVRLVEEGGRVKVSIADNGGGVPPDQLKAIFKGQFTTKKEGAGLGLVTAQRIVQGSKGTITASSTEGQGSVFVVEMPAV
jgi:C4-dicarboxylate-specific signal transduction histidine kinase